MAKRKEGQLTYGQMPLPQAQSAYTRLKVNWSGLNRRQTVDTGVLSMESNISTAEAPYLTPSQKPAVLLDTDQREMSAYYNKSGNTVTKCPISMFGFDRFLIVIYRDGAELKIDYIELNDNGKGVKHIHTGYVTQRNKDGDITTQAVDKTTDSIQRSMVQFNVYENAADVLDGVYVKKLLLFPDKVSMYMKIVTVDTTDDMTDIDVMYYNTATNRYYTFQGNYKRSKGEYVIDDYGNKIPEFEYQPKSGKGYFMTDSLDVIVKEYYNDGYNKASGTYNDGYKKTEDVRYNDGYKKTKYTFFADGYMEVSGTYNASKSQPYFARSGSVSPYTYTAVYLNDGDSLDGLYSYAPVSVMANKTFYTRGKTLPYEYMPVENLSQGDSLTGYYEKVSDSTYPYTKKVYYRRIVGYTSAPEGAAYESGVYYNEKEKVVSLNKGDSLKGLYTSRTVTYEEVTDLEYGSELGNGYYEKVSENNDEIQTYFKRSGEAPPYEYKVAGDLDNGTKLKGYYIFTADYAPSAESNKNCYWRNAFNNDCYCYDEDDEGNKGFKIAVPPAFPNLKYAAVHLSRLFGVDEDRVHVSGFNDYANWNLDTVAESNESNAWSSAAQANTKANGEFTGITVYDNHVVCFKRDFMHEIYNNKNPFRLVDVYAEGSIDNRSIQEVDGKLIFVSEDEVKVYTGGNPRIIGYYLGIDKFTSAVSGSDGRNYYLYCEEKTKDKDGNTVNNKYLFVYDTFVEQWSQRSIDDDKNDGEVFSFAHNKNGMYMLTDKGIIYKLDTGKYNHDWSFETDMSTSLNASSSNSYPTVSVKHLSKLQMLAYIPTGSSMKIYALYDSENYIEDENKDWKDNNKAHLLWDSAGRNGMIPIRLKPRMTANYGFKLHFEGSGYVRLYEMELRTTAGGELFRDS